MPNDTFYRDTIVLTISNLAMGILRFMFSIILSRQLGPEGVGLYGLIMPIFDLFCCLVCGGLIAAISKEVSSYHGSGNHVNLHKTINTSVIFIIIWSVFISISVFLLSPLLSKYIIKDPRALYSIMIISPALIFIAISSIYKGYFYGVSQVVTPAIIDIVEKAARMILLLGVIFLLKLTSIESTVAATYFSFTVGEILSFIFLFIFYKKSSRKLKPTYNEKMETSPQLLFNILVMSVPLAINGFLTTAIQGVSTLMIPRRLIVAGFSYIGALELIGKFSGMALTIVYFPVVIVASLSTVLIPDISKKLSRRDYANVESRVNEAIKICFLIGISTILICTICPDTLGKLFFKRDDLGGYIKLASLSAPFMYCSGCTYSILNSLGKQKTILINSILTSVIQLILIFVLIGIPSINIIGYGISMILSSIIGLIINLYEISKVIHINFPIGQIIIMALLILFITFALITLNRIIPSSLLSMKTIIIVIVAFSLIFIEHFLNKISYS